MALNFIDDVADSQASAMNQPLPPGSEVAQNRLNCELQQQEELTQRAKAAAIEKLAADLKAAQESLEAIRNSFWLRLGKKLDIGPWTESGFHLKKLGRWSGKQGAWLQRRLAEAWTAVCRFGDTANHALSGALSGLAAAWQFAVHYVGISAALVLLVFAALAFALEDLLFVCFGKRRLPPEKSISHQAASVVIANWNGRALLKSYLPSVVAALSGNAQNEIIVVDNASTDDSVQLLRTEFSQVRVLKMNRNLGFGGGSNAGVKAARNDVVVLLNNDMKVAPDFLAPLLEPFADPLTFAVSSQIFFYDKTKQREETGLTEVRWENGMAKPGHRVDPTIGAAFPCAYPGGGSSAFDRAKLLELGGFDSLFEPFYYEDTDLGFRAWRRGWKVLYEPRSIVNHCHRATIAKKFSNRSIQCILNRNAALYCWKNLHNWTMLGHHLWACFLDCWQRTGRPAGQTGFVDVWNAFRQLGPAMRSRWNALSTSARTDEETFNQPLGGYFRDRFIAPFTTPPARLNVLFVAPFPMEPPIHGGGVFMKQTVIGLASRTDVHLVSFLDNEHQLKDQQPLKDICKSAQFIVRPIIGRTTWTLTPFPVLQFRNRDFLWILHRTMLLQEIDVVQLEYTMLGQYAGQYRSIPCLLFEHDIASQSLRRGLKRAELTGELLIEYLRMRFYEPKILRRVSRVQVCSRVNAKYLKLLAPDLSKVDTDMRAAIHTHQYLNTTNAKREVNTILFVGGFSHPPNVEGLNWFIHQVFTQVLEEMPGVVLHIVGANPPTEAVRWMKHPNIRFIGAVPDVRVPLQQAAVFICPILTGSGIRVKLLEAFASKIPVVSTTIGAEGLADKSGIVCELADTPASFARSVLLLLKDQEYSKQLAARAQTLVQEQHDSEKANARLELSYQSEVAQVRSRGKLFSASA